MKNMDYCLNDNTSTSKSILLPFGTSDFEEIRKNGLYYVDKTYLIKELIEFSTKVTLFTRPRRFGKTLTMSMLHSFLIYKKTVKNCLMV